MAVFEKIGIEERFVKVIQPMYENTCNRVRINGFFTFNLLVQVGLHQGSCHSTRSIVREIRSGCSSELRYADYLALISDSFEGLKVRLEAWKGLF